MGVNALTFLLGVLAGGVLLANAVLGEGWIAKVIGGDGDNSSRGSGPPASSIPATRRPMRDLPPGYNPPSAEEMLRMIPQEDLRRMQESSR